MCIIELKLQKAIKAGKNRQFVSNGMRQVMAAVGVSEGAGVLPNIRVGGKFYVASQDGLLQYTCGTILSHVVSGVGLPSGVSVSGSRQ